MCPPSPGSAQEGKVFAACQHGFYPVPAATGTLRISGAHKALLASSPFLPPPCLCASKWGIFCSRPRWAGSAAVNYSEKLPPSQGWEGRGVLVKHVALKRIGRKRGLGAPSFPQPVTRAAMHPLIWEEVWWDGRWELWLRELLWGTPPGLQQEGWASSVPARGTSGKTHNRNERGQTPSGTARSALL